MSEQGYVNIRRATIADAVLLAELAWKTFYDAFGEHPLNRPEDLAAYMATAFGPEIQAAELNDKRNTFLLAESAGQPVGYAKLIAGSTEPCVTATNPVELSRLYSLQEYLGRGVGAALMQACIDEAVRQGHDVMWLGVWEVNYRAQRFYQKYGFAKCGEHTFHLGADPQTDWVMQRTLNDESTNHN